MTKYSSHAFVLHLTITAPSNTYQRVSPFCKKSKECRFVNMYKIPIA